MAETGAEPSTIKNILGHPDMRMTDRYTHAVESRKRAALERIAGYGKSAEVIHLEDRKIG
jgi:site-specific recombinase XerD